MKNLIILFIFLPFLVSASSEVYFLKYKTNEFNPSQNQTINIPFYLSELAQVTLALYSADNDIIRTLSQEKLSKGEHSFIWDGKDEQGEIVPDEAYTPVLKVKFQDKEIIVDPRDTSGGEVIEKLTYNIQNNQRITYNLPLPARVLIRVGIQNGGPMLRGIATWQVRNTGRNMHYWDGYDQDYLQDLRTHPQKGIVVLAFALPDHTIITTGNTKLDYFIYRNNKDLPYRPVDWEKRILERNGKRIAPQYHVPHHLHKMPEITVDLKYTSKNLMAIKVNIAQQDLWTVQESLYEVSFYIDNQFISEEEQGYMPLTWIWNPKTLAIGEHILTVNITSFSGRVGLKSIKFKVE